MYIKKKSFPFCKRARFLFRRRGSSEVRRRAGYVYIIYIYNRIKMCFSPVYTYSKNRYIRWVQFCCEIFLRVL